MREVRKKTNDREMGEEHHYSFTQNLLKNERLYVLDKALTRAKREYTMTV